MPRSLFIAATGKDVGKTTVCLGFLSFLQEKFEKLAFLKPVGQSHKSVGNGLKVDKDAVLFHEHFSLSQDYRDMSPVIVHKGFTKEFIDGKYTSEYLEKSIIKAFEHLSEQADFTLIEGTGHMGVGSIVGLSNAKVAKILNTDVVLISSAGLGSTFDTLALNKALCDAEGVRIRGVIINRFKAEKGPKIPFYMEKALSRWDIPLIATIPYHPFLSKASMQDFVSLFEMPLCSGKKNAYRHFTHIRLVATSLSSYKSFIRPRQLIITPSQREDIIESTLHEHLKHSCHGEDFGTGMILTGRKSPSPSLLEIMREAEIPVIYAPISSFQAMKKINSFRAKIPLEDTEKVKKAISHVRDFVDFSSLL